VTQGTIINDYMECKPIKYISVPHSFHNELYRVVRFEVLTDMLMKIHVFWAVITC